MELILILALILILFVVYILVKKESFTSRGDRKINDDSYAYRTRSLGGALKWPEYESAQNHYNKFKIGNSNLY